MSEPRRSRTQRELTARSAIWLTCPDCGQTSRVLAVMASRVLKERRECAQCLSPRAPHLTQTQQGAHIPVPAEFQAASNEEEAYLRAWVEADDRKSRLRHLTRVLLSRLAARFSRAKSVKAGTQACGPGDDPGLNLTHSEK